MPAPDPTPDGGGGLGFVTGFGDVVGVSDGFIVHGTPGTDPSGWRGDVALIRRSDMAQPRPSRRRISSSDMQSCCLGRAARSSRTGSGASTSGPRRVPPNCRWPRNSRRHGSKGIAIFGRSAGPLGLVAVQKDDHQKILFTRDGVDWDIQPMPAEMAADHTTFYGWPSVVVGDRSVLVVLWSGTGRGTDPNPLGGHPRAMKAWKVNGSLSVATVALFAIAGCTTGQPSGSMSLPPPVLIPRA